MALYTETEEHLMMQSEKHIQIRDICSCTDSMECVIISIHKVQSSYK